MSLIGWFAITVCVYIVSFVINNMWEVYCKNRYADESEKDAEKFNSGDE